MWLLQNFPKYNLSSIIVDDKDKVGGGEGETSRIYHTFIISSDALL